MTLLTLDSRTMRAVVIEAPGEPKVLTVVERPVPTPETGEVLLRVRAFGLNRWELHFRRGMADFGTFPRIPGLEAVGEVVSAPAVAGLVPGQKVAALMGGMGREFDGGYAQYACVPAEIVVPFDSDLPWEVLGAVPEMLQTAYGSLTVGADVPDGGSLLIRGGTSSVGQALAVLALRRGIQVVSTTRSASRLAALRALGVQFPVVDDGEVARQVRAHFPNGVDGAVELVGAPTLKDTLAAVRTGGTACFTGMLSDDWTIPQFYPMDWLPNGVRLTAYSGEANNLPSAVLQEFLDAVATGEIRVPIGKVHRGLPSVVRAHTELEEGTVPGKHVVVP